MDTEEGDPQINSIMSQPRNTNAVMVNSSSAQDDDLALVDSGADTYMMGNNFYIETRNGRTINIEVFGGNTTVIRGMEICTRITLAINQFDQPVLLRVHNGVITEYKFILVAN